MPSTHPAKPVMSEATCRDWYSPDSKALLISFNSSDREPFYIPERFHTLASLKQLAAAIQEAIAMAES